MNHLPNSCLSLFLFLGVLGTAPTPIAAFGTALFPEPTVLQQQTFPTKDQGQEIELPNFDELFDRVEQVSPLARLALQTNQPNTFEEDPLLRKRGFAAIEADDLKWKQLESNSKRLVHQVEKIDDFQGIKAPILRFRASMEGPCDGEAFANFIMNLEDRQKWDAQIDNVYEIYTIDDLDSANVAMGLGKYGDCSRLGVGHCLTKANLGIDAREQLTLCGINDFADGSCIIWGTEMEEGRHDHLFPPGPRSTRAKSHIFCTTLTPTSPNSFDVEYVLQLEIGGKIPAWMTTPIVIDNVKKLFTCSQKFYKNTNGELATFLAQKAQRQGLPQGPSFLMTP